MSFLSFFLSSWLLLLLLVPFHRCTTILPCVSSILHRIFNNSSIPVGIFLWMSDQPVLLVICCYSCIAKRLQTILDCFVSRYTFSIPSNSIFLLFLPASLPFQILFDFNLQQKTSNLSPCFCFVSNQNRTPRFLLRSPCRIVVVANESKQNVPRPPLNLQQKSHGLLVLFLFMFIFDTNKPTLSCTTLHVSFLLACCSWSRSLWDS